MRSWRNWHTHENESLGFLGSSPSERTTLKPHPCLPPDLERIL